MVDPVHDCFRTGKWDHWWLESWTEVEPLELPSMMTPEIYRKLCGDQLERMKKKCKHIHPRGGERNLQL